MPLCVQWGHSTRMGTGARSQRGAEGLGKDLCWRCPPCGWGGAAAPPPGPMCAPTLPSTPGTAVTPTPTGTEPSASAPALSHPPPSQQGSPTVWRSQKAQHQLQSQSLFVGSPPPANQSVRRSPRSAGGRRTPHSHPTLSSAPLAEEPGPSPPQGMAPHINTDIQITKIALEYSQMNKNYSDMYSRARALCTQPGQPGGPGGLPGMRSCS